MNGPPAPDAEHWLASEAALARIRQGLAQVHELPKDQQSPARLAELRHQAVAVHYERIRLLLAARKHASGGRRP